MVATLQQFLMLFASEVSTSYVVGIAICIVLLLQWTYWQITDSTERQTRAERKAAKKARRRGDSDQT